ncbi:MAG: ATP-binding protein [Myxococcota bacterium]
MPNRPTYPSFESSQLSPAALGPLAKTLSRAIAQAPEGIALFSADGEELLYANSAFSNLLCSTQAALSTATLFNLFADDTLTEALHTALRTQRTYSAHVTGATGRALAITVSPARAEEISAPEQWLCTLRPASVQLERERLTAVSMLAAGLAHEINNPLASVTTNLEWIVATLPSLRPSQTSSRPNSLPALSAALVDALAGAERIEAAVRQLNALAGVQHEQPELLDVRVLLDAALHEVEPLLGDIEVRRDYAEVPPILSSQARLKQAFAQLLSNAAQAIGPDSQRRSIDVRARKDDRVRVEIDDTGTGVAPHLVGELFRPFVTTKPLGLGKGLGLYLARGSVEAAGGEIGFEALGTGGTRFWIELPGVETRMRSPLDSNSDLESVPPK